MNLANKIFNSSCVVIFGLVLVQTLNAQDDTLKQMKFFDTLLSSSARASGVVKRTPPRGSIHLSLSKNWDYSASSDTVALTESAAAEPMLPYHAPPAEQGVIINFDNDENMYVSVETKTTWLFDDDSSRRYSQYTSFKVDKSGEITDRTPNHSFRIFDPDDLALVIGTQSMKFAMGRGFSSCIEQLLETDVTASGLLKVKASGTLVGGDSPKGFWDLEIDPSSEFLVRSAAFSFELDSGETYLSVVTTGTIDETDMPIASAGEVWLPSANLLSEYSIGSFSLEPDHDLIRACEKDVERTDLGRTVITDNRFEPAKITVNDIPPPVRRPSRLRTWLYLFFGGVVFVGIVLVFFRSSKKNQA